MDRILVLRGGALGDLIVTLPALAALRERWPASRIELIGNATAGELALAAKRVDVVHSQHEARWSKFYGADELSGESRGWLREFDLVINFWPDPDGNLARKFPVRNGQLFLHGTAMPQIAPAAAHYQSTLAALGLNASQTRYDLSPFFSPPELLGKNSSAPQLAATSSKARIAIHAGSGSSRKNWPASRWTEVAQWLRDSMNAELVIVSGEAETIDILDGFGTTVRARPLGELASILRTCAFFLGHDSGVSHLAAALGLECILLFGPTDSAMWAPPGAHVRVIKQGEQLDAISVAQVQRAVSSMLSDRK